MSTSYTVTRDQVISSALRKLQVLELGDTPDTDTLNNASMVLNLMVKMWATGGLKMWTVEEWALPLVTSNNMYTLGPATTTGVTNAVTSALTYDKPLRLIQAWLRNTSVTPQVDTPMQVLSKQEYNVLGSKQSTGVSNSVYLDPRATTSNLYVYLAPDANVPTTYQMHMIVQRVMSDLSASSDIPDFPVEWMQALVWGLADQLAIEYSVPANHRQEIALKAEMYRQHMEGWDVEEASTFFVTDSRMGWNR